MLSSVALSLVYVNNMYYILHIQDLQGGHVCIHGCFELSDFLIECHSYIVTSTSKVLLAFKCIIVRVQMLADDEEKSAYKRIKFEHCLQHAFRDQHILFINNCYLRDFSRETQTAPVLTELALSAFEKWFIADDELILDPLAYPTQVHRLIEEQNAIAGWRQLFSGRFSCEWSTLQNASYSRAPPPDGQQKRTGLQWQTKFILKIWEGWDERWSDRNKALHGHDAATRSQAMRRETRRHLLDNIYRDRKFMEPHVQAFLQDSPEAHAAQSVSTTRNWIATHQAMFRNTSVRRMKARTLLRMQLIRSYFQPSIGG